MGHIVHLGGKAPSSETAQGAAPGSLRSALLVALLVTVIIGSLGVVLYVSWPRTPRAIPVSAALEVQDDDAVFEPKAAEERQRKELAEQEKEDRAVFGQAPSDPAYFQQQRH
jgi:cell division septal protein FtsQ